MTDSEYMEEAAVLRPRLVGVARQYVGDEAEAVSYTHLTLPTNSRV